MKRTILLFAAMIVCTAAASAQETIKDRKNYIPSRKHVAIPGTAIGILLADGQAILSTEGRSGPADQLVFSTGGNSYRWVYVPTQDRPLITNLQVPVGDKGEKTVYAALNMANPQSVLPWTIKTPYTLVEVEVNNGRGSPAGDSFVGTNFKVLDGTADYPLKVADVVKQVKDQYAEHVAKQKETIEKAITDAGEKALAGQKPTGPRERKELMYLTWLPESSTMRVHFGRRSAMGRINCWWRQSKGPAAVAVAWEKSARLGRRQWPNIGPVKVGTTFGIEFGLAYTVNKKGEIVDARELPMESFTQQLNPPPAIGPRPGPLPVPVPPARDFE